MLEVADVRVDPRHWIGGERVSSADTFDDLSPIDGTVLGQVARGQAAEVDAAVAAARDAFPGWAKLGPCAWCATWPREPWKRRCWQCRLRRRRLAKVHC